MKEAYVKITETACILWFLEFLPKSLLTLDDNNVLKVLIPSSTRLEQLLSTRLFIRDSKRNCLDKKQEKLALFHEEIGYKEIGLQEIWCHFRREDSKTQFQRKVSFTCFHNFPVFLLLKMEV